MELCDNQTDESFFEQFKTEKTSLSKLGKMTSISKVDKYEDAQSDYSKYTFCEEYPFPDELTLEGVYEEPTESERVCYTHIIDAKNIIDSTVTIELPQVPKDQRDIIYWD